MVGPGVSTFDNIFRVGFAGSFHAWLKLGDSPLAHLFPVRDKQMPPSDADDDIPSSMPARSERFDSTAMVPQGNLIP